MADRFPLIVDTSTNTIKEIPTGDNLNLIGCGLVNVSGLGVTNANLTGVATVSQLVVNTIDVTPIHEITTIHVATTGSDTTGTGTSTSPFKTPHKAMKFLRNKRISVTDGYSRVTVSVGVGTYNFGLNQTAAGTGYISGTYPVSGGTGSGAFVGITTTTSGAVKAIKLLDPGTGYLASDTLGVSTSTGTGCVFNPFHVGDEGEILGQLSIDHVDGDQITITGGTKTGVQPGKRGNHFYNQVGVPNTFNPASTTATHTWKNTYDSSSPAGAYPNPMVNGRGNTNASNIYNRGILQAYYGTEFYFYGCDGLVAKSVTTATVKNLLLVGQHADGTRIEDDQERTVTGLTNSPSVGVATDATGTAAVEGLTRGGAIETDDVAIHGFTFGVVIYGGSAHLRNFTTTNSGSVGIIANSACQLYAFRCHSLNHRFHAVYSYAGIYFVYGGSMSNCGSIGCLNYYNGFGFLGNNDDPSTVSIGNSSIIANNSAYGVHAYGSGMIRCDGIYSTKQFVYANGTAQIYAHDAGTIHTQNYGGSLVVEAAEGSATLYSPAVNTVGNNNSIIVQ